MSWVMTVRGNKVEIISPHGVTSLIRLGQISSTMMLVENKEMLTADRRIKVRSQIEYFERDDDDATERSPI